eukprot:1536187-Rhodomonas_salina.1
MSLQLHPVLRPTTLLQGTWPGCPGYPGTNLGTPGMLSPGRRSSNRGKSTPPVVPVSRGALPVCTLRQTPDLKYKKPAFGVPL